MFIAYVLASCASNSKIVVSIPDEVVNESTFVKGMKGAENIYLDKKSLDFYATDCSGSVYKVSGYSRKTLTIVKSLNLGAYALGIDMSTDGNLYVAASGKDWLEIGGRVFKVDSELRNYIPVTGYYPGINGVIIKGTTIYFAAGKMSFFSKDGSIYKMTIPQEGEEVSPDTFISGLKSPNGLNLNWEGDKLIFSETFTGISSAGLDGNSIESVFGKSRVVEGFDDLAVDSYGNYWVADQPNGFIKMYNPVIKRVYYFRHKDLGIASSCRIRVENSENILYISEIKRSKKSKNYDGRGVIALPVEQLIALIPHKS